MYNVENIHLPYFAVVSILLLRNFMIIIFSSCFPIFLLLLGSLHELDRMVVGFTTTYAINAYHH
jgi:hypothetical protein